MFSHLILQEKYFRGIGVRGAGGQYAGIHPAEAAREVLFPEDVL